LKQTTIVFLDEEYNEEEEEDKAVARSLSCDYCGEQFSRDFALANHLKIAHTANKVLKQNGMDLICKVCFKEFATKWTLKNHFDREGTKCKPLKNTQ